MKRIIDPDQYVPPCGQHTCTDKATEAGIFCSYHWYSLPEYLRGRILMAVDRHECAIFKDRPPQKPMIERHKAMRCAVDWLNGRDARELPPDYQRAC